MDNTNLNLKLNNDIKLSIKKELEKYDSNIDTKMHVKLLLFHYINWRKRFIKEKKRNVVFSNEIKQNPLYPKYKKAIENIKYKSQLGKELVTHLSKQIAFNAYTQNSTSKDNDKDNFLNAFGIHHFHLGEKYKKKDKVKDINFIGRTGALLFVLVKEDTLYLIDILPYHNFGNLNLFKIIKRNWEYLIERYEFKDILQIRNSNRNDKETQSLLQSGINPTIQIDDKIYSFSSITTSGHDMNVSRNIDLMVEHLNKIYQILSIANMTKIKNPEYKIIIRQGLLYLIEEKSNKTICINSTLENMLIVDGYCTKGYELFNFNS